MFCVLCVVSWVVCCALPVCILCSLYRIVSTYVDTFCDLETDVCHARLCQTHRLWNCKKTGPGLARLSADHATGFRHANWCSLRKSAFLAPYAWGWSDFHLYRQSSLHGSRGGTTWVTLPNFAKKTCCRQAILSHREGYGTEATPTDIPDIRRCQVRLIGCITMIHQVIFLYFFRMSWVRLTLGHSESCSSNLFVDADLLEMGWRTNRPENILMGCKCL